MLTDRHAERDLELRRANVALTLVHLGVEDYPSVPPPPAGNRSQRRRMARQRKRFVAQLVKHERMLRDAGYGLDLVTVE